MDQLFNFMTVDEKDLTRKIHEVPSKFISYSPLLYTFISTEVPLERCSETNAIIMDPIVTHENFANYIRFLCGRPMNYLKLPAEDQEELMYLFNYMGHENPLGYPAEIFLAKLENTWFRDNYTIHELSNYHGLVEVPIDEIRYNMIESWVPTFKNCYIAGSFAMYLAGACEDPRDIDIFTINKKSMIKQIKKEAQGKSTISVGANCIDFDFRPYYSRFVPDTNDYYKKVGTRLYAETAVTHHTRKLSERYGFILRNNNVYVIPENCAMYHAKKKEYISKVEYIFDYFSEERMARYRGYEKLYDASEYETADFEHYQARPREEILEYLKSPKTALKNICAHHKIVNSRPVLHELGQSTKQFVLKEYKSPAHIVHFFDLDCCGYIYEPKTHRLFATRRALVSIRHMTNYFDPVIASKSYGYRLAKYTIRGFEPWLPFYDKVCIDIERMEKQSVRFMLYNIPYNEHYNSSEYEKFKATLTEDFSYDYMSIILAAKLFNWIVPDHKSMISCYQSDINKYIRRVTNGKISYDPYENNLIEFLERVSNLKVKKDSIREIVNIYPEPHEEDILKWYTTSPYVSIRNSTESLKDELEVE